MVDDVIMTNRQFLGVFVFAPFHRSDQSHSLHIFITLCYLHKN